MNIDGAERDRRRALGLGGFALAAAVAAGLHAGGVDNPLIRAAALCATGSRPRAARASSPTIRGR